MDVAGVVAAVGEGVGAFAEGDAVFGMAGGVGGHPGALAEYMAADTRLLARKPKNLTMREAAAVPLAFITAWEGLVDRANLGRGQRVLVLGGAGGVGQMALQIAKARAAETFATGSLAAEPAVEKLGARFVDRTMPPAELVSRCTGGQGFDIVFDTAGGASLDAALLHGAPLRPCRQRPRLGSASSGAAILPGCQLFRHLHPIASAHRRRPRVSRGNPHASGRSGRGRTVGSELGPAPLHASNGEPRVSSGRRRHRPGQIDHRH